EIGIDHTVVMFTRNAPAKIAGHKCGPSSSNAANAIPVAGQTAVALGLEKARARPSRPAQKYTAANSRILTDLRSAEFCNSVVSGTARNSSAKPISTRYRPGFQTTVTIWRYA